ncbi:MAG: AAA domain-containing protein [Candidatus Dadabacteria bacterium]|nr:AAA domain-containing protein [Candidatus Dadabacteria bacterium]
MHQKRNIPWLQILRFHKEITRRGEENFFALPVDQLDSDRCSSLYKFEFKSFAGPWQVDPDTFKSKPFLQKLKRKEVDEIFLGGPCWYKAPRKNDRGSGNWLPVLYRQIKFYLDTDSVCIVPDQGKWEISPLVYDLLESKSAQSRHPLEQWLPNLIEITQNLSTTKNIDLTEALIDILSSNIPELGEELRKKIQSGISHLPSPWIIFSPTTSSSPVYQHLMSDYEELDKILEKQTDNIGGFELLEDIAVTENAQSVSLLPVVPLNRSQEKAVLGILAGKPVTVISGPPGTGKSQVVVSSLLNCWSQGKSVLFASQNNQAVDTVRERIKKFEDQFPIAIRTGSKRYRTDFNEALRRILNAITYSTANSLSTKQDASQRKDSLLSKKKQIEEFLDSKLPQRINESLSSSLEAYALHQSTLAELQEAKESLRSDLRKIGYTLDAEDFKRLVFDPLNTWVGNISSVKKEIIDNKKKEELYKSEATEAEEKRNQSVQTLGLDFSKVRSWDWLISAQGPESLQAWLTSFHKLIDNIHEHDLEVLPWDNNYEYWKSSEQAEKWSENTHKLVEVINSDFGQLEQLIKEVAEAESELNQEHEVSNSLLDIMAKPHLLDALQRWTTLYSEYCTQPKTWVSWLPFSDKSKLNRAIREVEKILLPTFPASMWQRVGPLNDEGRRRFVQIIEKNEKWLDLRKATDIKQDSIRSKFREFRTLATNLRLADIPQSEDLNLWMKFAEVLAENQKIAKVAATAWRHRENREKICGQLQQAVSKYNTIASGIPLREAWVSGIGAQFHETINALNSTPSFENIVAVRTVLYSKDVDEFIEIWKEARKHEKRLRSIQSSVEELPTKLDLIENWWNIKPDLVPIEAHQRSQLPKGDDVVFEHTKTCQEWLESWNIFVSRTRQKYEDKLQEEKNWACKKLAEAGELIPNKDKKNIQVLIDQVVGKDTDEWPVTKLRDAFGKFEPVRLKARVENINYELEKLSFDEAKDRWVQQLSQDPEIQDVLRQLLDRYQQSGGGSILPEDYDLFEKALKAIPVWIITALSPQSLPLIPHLFDVLVIDEATQCTITNLLPLIYRAKSLVVIGDPEQLPAIPTLRENAERTLAQNFQVDQWLDLLGHSQRTVYDTAVQCLPRRYSDIVLLEEHYRSHPLIIGFSNRYIYQKRLQLKKDSIEISNALGISGIDVQGFCKRGQLGRSWINEKEAEKVVTLIQELRNNNRYSNFTIGVVTPFRSQADLIANLIEKQTSDSDIHRDITIGTVHTYQGDERDLMIFSPVVSKGISDNTVQWVGNPNMINVAVTRAREGFFFVADFGVCRRQRGVLGHLTRYVEDVENLRKTSAEELELFSWMVMQGWDPEVHPKIRDIEVDFVLKKAGRKIVVEVDGEQHKRRRVEDKSRDVFLNSRGYEVYRFPTREVREAPASIIHLLGKKLSGEFS